MFKLSIIVDSSAQIKSMKNDLAKYFPNIKSSHRAEALARAFGFKTNAALIAAIKQFPAEIYKESVQLDVNWESFNDYLLGKGYQATAKPLYIAAGRAFIRLAMEIYPHLTHEGNGIDKTHHNNETREEYLKRFKWERNSMLSDIAVEEFLRSYAFVSRIPATRTITTKRGSYNLKHIAENVNFTYPDGEESPAKYVREGSLIFAALNAGFWYKDGLYQHVLFNMSQKSIDKLDREIRPNKYN